MQFYPNQKHKKKNNIGCEIIQIKSLFLLLLPHIVHNSGRDTSDSSNRENNPKGRRYNKA
jgi:hypothetical protein